MYVILLFFTNNLNVMYNMFFRFPFATIEVILGGVGALTIHRKTCVSLPA